MIPGGLELGEEPRPSRRSGPATTSDPRSGSSGAGRAGTIGVVVRRTSDTIPGCAGLPRSRLPWRYVVIALLILAAIVFLRWLDEDTAAVSVLRHDGCSQTVEIHYKLAPGATTHLAAQPLFTHLPATAAASDDPRARWRRIEVPRHRAAQVLARLAHDPAGRAGVRAADDHAAAAGGRCRATATAVRSPRRRSSRIRATSAGAARHRCAGRVAARRARAGRVVRRHRGRLERRARGSARRADHARRRARRSTTRAGARTAPRCSARSSGATTARASSGSRRMSSACSPSSIGGLAVADAIDAAAEALRPGDVLLIELQGSGPRGRYLPVEYWDDNYDAIQAATARGVVVIEAAGNGAEDLDHNGVRAASSIARTRDSGAIMVGAGGAAARRLRRSREARLLELRLARRRPGLGPQGRHARLRRPPGLRRRAAIVTTRRVLRHVERVADRRGRRGAPRELVEADAATSLAPREVRDLLRRTGTPQTGDGDSTGAAADRSAARSGARALRRSVREAFSTANAPRTTGRSVTARPRAVASRAIVVERRGVLLAEVARLDSRGPCSRLRVELIIWNAAVRAGVVADACRRREPCAYEVHRPCAVRRRTRAAWSAVRGRRSIVEAAVRGLRTLRCRRRVSKILRLSWLFFACARISPRLQRECQRRSLAACGRLNATVRPRHVYLRARAIVRYAPNTRGRV